MAAFLDGRIGFLEIAALVEDVLARVDGAPARDLDELREADRRARELVETAWASSRRSSGSPLLVLIHEAGHFFAARAVGMTPRKFYLGFGPPIVKTTRGGVEYGIGVDPARRLREDPGHEPPVAGRPERDARRRTCARRIASRARAARRGDRARRLTTRRAPSSPRCGRRSARPRLCRSSTWSLAAGRVLAADDLAAARRDRRRPGGQPRLRVRALRGALHGRDDAQHERDRAGREGLAGRCRRPPQRATGSSRRGCTRCSRRRSRTRSAARRAARSRLVVDRDGQRVVIGPAARTARPTASTASASRSRRRAGPGESLPAAAKDALVALVGGHRRHGRGLGHLAHRPRHEPRLELGRHRAGVSAGVASRSARLPVRARPDQPRARPAEPAPGAAARRRPHRDGARSRRCAAARSRSRSTSATASSG